MVKGRVETKHTAAKQHVVQVGNDEIGVVNVDVKGHGGNHHTAETTHHKHRHKPDRKQHGGIQPQFATPNGGHPTKHFDSGGHGDDHGGNHEKHPQPCRCATGEHVVCPNNQAQQTDGNAGIGDRLVTKNRFASMDGQNFGNGSKQRQDHDVNRWVGIEPKHVLIDDRVTAPSGVKKGRSRHQIKGQQHQCASQHRGGHQNQNGSGQHGPTKQRHVI